MAWPKHLKMIPGRPDERLKYIHRGHVDFNDTIFDKRDDRRRLVAWGLIHRLPEVDWYDAYGGFRPTRKGLKEYFFYDEEFHLFMVRKSKWQQLWDRLIEANEIVYESATASFGLEMQMAHVRGFQYDPEFALKDEDKRKRSIQRYEKRGFVLLENFLRDHDMGKAELFVAGVLRYLERDPDRISDYVIGKKAGHCLLLNDQRQLILVRPGKDKELLELCLIEDRSK